MRKVTIKAVKVYGAIRYTDKSRANKEIQCKLRLLLSPALYQRLIVIIDAEHDDLQRMDGYKPDRQDTLPVKMLDNGWCLLSVRSGTKNKKYSVQDAERLENADRINCTLLVYAYADKCQQGVKIRLADYEICSGEA